MALEMDGNLWLELVGSLMSPDNDKRSQAESKYADFNEEVKVQNLLKCIAAAEEEVSSMAAVLLRRLLSSMDDFVTKISPGTQETCKLNLLNTVHTRSEPQVCKKICDCIAELAKCYLDDNGNNQWPAILEFLYQCCIATDMGSRQKEVALHIIIAFPGIFGSQQDTYLRVIIEMLSSCFKDGNPDTVRLLSSKATCTFITECVDDTKYQSFVEIVPHILKSIEYSVKSESDDSLLKAFVELVEVAPKLMRPTLHKTLELMLAIVGNSELEDSWRQLALEAMVTISENAPAMFRKHGGEMIKKIINEMLALMVDLEDDEDWSFNDDVDDVETDSNPVAGESSLDRFACGLGGKTVLPHITSTIPQMLQNPDWRYRHAGLMAISAVAEGCVKQMEPILKNVVDYVVPYLQDPHPRVRHATCNALGQLATDFSILFQRDHHAKVMPSLLGVLATDHAHPRVQAHAAAALVNFCEECPPKVLEPYLDKLVEVLEGVLKSKIEELAHRGTKLVLEQTLTTIATVADTAEAKFTSYYDRFMPHLKFIFQNATSPEYRLLRGKSIECISLIGLAVGKEKFYADASDVMQLLLQTQSGVDQLEADDPQISYLISAWARMCKIIGPDFVKYLSVVMPPVLKAAQIKPEVALLDVDDPSNRDLDEDDGWEFVSLGEQQKFGIKTAGLEDKSTACQMLVHYARELKGGFVDYVEDVVHIMVPLLKFYFHDTVRVTAAESLPHLLECAAVKGESYVSQVWAHICPELLSAIEKEPEEAVVPELMDSFSKCVETMDMQCMSADQLQQLARIIHEKLEQHLSRQQERLSKRHDEDYDAEVEDELQDEHETDEYILSKVSDMMHVLFKTHWGNLLPLFEFLLNDFVKLLDPSRPGSDKQWTLCIFDDLVEYASPESWAYREYFVEPMLKYIEDDGHPEVRQAAAYGCGVMAQFGGINYAEICALAAPKLGKVIEREDSRSKENVNPTENCISAITKICKYNSSLLDVESILPHWFSWLPITEDKEEAPHVYGYMCDLIVSNHPAIVGIDHSNLPLILTIIATAIIKDVLSNDTVQSTECLQRMRDTVHQVKSKPELWDNCLLAIKDGELLETLKNL